MQRPLIALVAFFGVAVGTAAQEQINRSKIVPAEVMLDETTGCVGMRRLTMAIVMMDGKVDLSELSHYPGAALYMTEGMAIFRSRGRYGFCKADGTVAAKPQYDQVRPFSEGRAAIKQGDKEGFIDKTGQVIVKPIYDTVDAYSDGMASVEIRDDDLFTRKYGFVNRAGKLVTPIQFDEVRPFSEGRALVAIFKESDGKR